jgi:hypothetical protein
MMGAKQTPKPHNREMCRAPSRDVKTISMEASVASTADRWRHCGVGDALSERTNVSPFANAASAIRGESAGMKTIRSQSQRRFGWPVSESSMNS